MKTNIVNLRKKLSEMLDYVKEGNELEIQKRNVVIAKVIPVAENGNENQTKLDVGKGTVKYYGDVTEPALEDDWEMHK